MFGVQAYKYGQTHTIKHTHQYSSDAIHPQNFSYGITSCLCRHFAVAADSLLREMCVCGSFKVIQSRRGRRGTIFVLALEQSSISGGKFPRRVAKISQSTILRIECDYMVEWSIQLFGDSLPI